MNLNEYIGIKICHKRGAGNRWPTKKLKFIASVKVSNVDKKTKNGEQSVRLCNYTDVYYNEYITQDIDFMKASATPDEIKKFKIRSGDIIITKDSESWEDIAVPAYALTDFEDVLCGYHLAQIRPEKSIMDSEYLFRAFSSRGINDQFRVASTGITRYGLGRYAIDNAFFYVPPVKEQRAIARFLKKETARIDTLIAKKERQIELLKEKRSALISHAVTKGLNPDAKMKDSGVDWLGETPSHWVVGNIRRFAKMKTGHTPSRNHPEYWENCTIPWFSLADVWQLRDGRRKYLEETKEKISELGIRHSAAELLPKGTVVFSRTASIGFSGIMPIAMATTQDFWNWICGPRLLPDYLLYLFRAMTQEFQALTMGSTHKTIYQPIAASISICVPTLSEQRIIVETIDRETNRIDALIDRVQKSINLLQEYRTALISAAVTGKIDVRKEEVHDAC